ncbi:MAG: DUF4347 domain-containing protein, partial [Deltaproteobacteria bacterium]|nr:DUF4347 domain-containing protein [Deltaproteobacteria bacterium]
MARRRGHQKKPQPEQPSGCPRLEALEPRVLLSTFTVALDADALDGTLHSADTGTGAIEFRLDETNLTASMEQAVAERRIELVFVDTGVEGYEALVDDLRSSSSETRSLEVFLLDPELDGIEQISDILADYEGLDAIHIISHGSEGAVQLGDVQISGTTLSSYESALIGWADSLAEDADLLFYGCDLAGGENGEALVGSIAKLTGANVAASADLTGAEALGGDWDLEYATGRIDTDLALGSETRSEWTGVLAVNTAPVNTLPSVQSIDVGATLVFSAANSNPISVSDGDADGADVEATLSVGNGTLNLAQTTGLAFSTGDGAADAAMTFTGTVTDINSALDGLSYSFDIGFNGTDTLTLTTQDLGNTGTPPLDQDANIQVKYTFAVDGTDEIGSNDATLVNGASVVVDAERGSVLDLDGSDDYASVPVGVTSGLSQFSFSFWVKTTESGTAGNYWQLPTLMGIETPGFGTEDFSVTTNAGYIGFWTGLSGATDDNYLSTTTQINDNSWHQITVSNDGSNASLYVDGAFEASLQTGNGLDAYSVYIGAQDSKGNDKNHHQGQYDDVRIFDRALTTLEAEELYSGLRDTDTVTIQHRPTAADKTVSTSEDTAYTFLASDFNFADVNGDSLTKVKITSLESNGALQLGGFDVVLDQEVAISDIDAGNLKFIPAPDENGSGYDSFEFEVHDGTAYSSSAYLMTLNVTPVNDAPVAVDDADTVLEGGNVTIDLAGNDTDADDGLDLSSIAIVSAPANGSVLVNGDGTITYTHNGSETISDSFTYTIKDLSGAVSNTATVDVTIDLINEAPINTVPGLQLTDEGVAIFFSGAGGNPFSISDVDAASGDMEVTLNATNGTLTLGSLVNLVFSAGDGSDDATMVFTGSVADVNNALEGMRFDPTDAGAASVQIITDDQGNTGSGGPYIADDTIAITVGEIAPVLSISGAPTVVAGQAYTLTLSASDPGDDTISGWTINWGDGTIDTVVGNPPTVDHVYANPGFTFNITASATDEDGTYLQNELLVAGSASDALYRYQETSGDFLQQIGSLADGLDYAGDVTVGPDGAIYVSGLNSDNVLRYNAATGALLGELVTSGLGGLNEPVGLAFGPDGYLYVASSGSDEVLRYDAATGAFIDEFVSSGSGGINAPEHLLFGPDRNLYVSGFDSNTVHRYDGSTGAFLDLFVSAGSGGLDSPEQMAFGPDGNLYVASDVNSNVLRFNGTTGAFIDEFVSAGSGGLSFANGLDFGPDGNLYVGSWSTNSVLRYQGPTGASPGAFIDEYASGGGLDKTVYLEFIPGQQVEVLASFPALDLDANDDSGSTGADFNTTFTEDGAPVLIADADATLTHAGPLTALDVTITNRLDGVLETMAADTTGTSITAAYDSGSGILTLSGAGSAAEYQQVLRTVTYANSSQAPNPTDRTITFVAAAGGNFSNVGTTTVTIIPINDAPVAVADADTVLEGGNVTIDLAGNDTDADDGLDLTSIAIIGAPANGSVLVNGDGTITYTHNGTETLSDSFTYTIQDLSGAVSNTATVNLTVTPQNDAPVAVADADSVNEGAAVVIDLAGNDTDPDNALDLGSIVITSAPANGSLVDNGDGTLTYT